MLRAIFLCKEPAGKERGNYCLLIGKLVASRSNICQLRGVEVRQGIKVSQECMLSVVMQKSDLKKSITGVDNSRNSAVDTTEKKNNEKSVSQHAHKGNTYKH